MEHAEGSGGLQGDGGTHAALAGTKELAGKELARRELAGTEASQPEPSRPQSDASLSQQVQQLAQETCELRRQVMLGISKGAESEERGQEVMAGVLCEMKALMSALKDTNDALSHCR